MFKKKGFTLVELLAVIVILAVILVIAVPQIMNTIKESRKGVLESSAKLIASSAETKKVSNDTLGIEEEITCEMVSKLNSEDYDNCTLTFDESGKAQVTIVGKGKFEGMSVCKGTKEDATAIEGICMVPGASNNIAKKADLNDYTWEEIQKIASDTNLDEDGLADFGIQVGDTKIHNGTTYYLVDDNRGTPNTYDGFVFMYDTKTYGQTNTKMNDSASNRGGYPSSKMKTYLDTLVNQLEVDLGVNLKEVSIVCTDGNNNPTGINTIEGVKLFLASLKEVGFDYTGYAEHLSYEGEVFEGFIGDSDLAQKKALAGGSGWWLRSTMSSSSYAFWYVFKQGGYATSIAKKNYLNASSYSSVVPAFVIG